MAKLHPATATAASLCRSRGALLEPAGVCATRSVPRRGSYIQQQGVLYPTPFERRELQSCTPELQPATGGAIREGGHFLPMHFFAEPIFCFCWNRCIFFLLEPR